MNEVANILESAEARALTDKIKIAVEGTWQLIEHAYVSRAWSSLGYTSWDDYCTREFGTSRLRLPREERQEVVASLRESGLSVRAIASATGLARNTVKGELRQVGQFDPPAQSSSRAATVGIDGKTYQPSRPIAPAPAPVWQEPADPDRDLWEDDLEEPEPQELRTAPLPERPVPARTSPVMLTLRTHAGDPVPYPKPQGKPTFNSTPGEGISWASWSWNPVTGCLHGCDYCYARELANSERLRAAYPVGFTPLFHPERLDAPAHTTIPAQYRDDPAWRRVFVCSMADLYGRWVPDEWVNAVHASMCKNPDWQYITLTKFPTRYVGLDMPPGAWVGTSVDEQKRVRIAEDAFRKIDGVAVKWLSLEPLREPLEFSDLSMFDWVVIGAQTETRQPDRTVPAFSPPFEWVARITMQALEAGCKVHHKPNLLGRTSGQLPGMQMLDQYPDQAGQ